MLDDLYLSISGINLAAGASCTFNITLQVPADAPGGTYHNITSDVSAMVDNTTVAGKPASADLVVLSAPELTKSFTDDPVIPGDTVTLEFTLSYDENAPASASDITFSDDLDDVVSDLAATGLPINDVCGAGSQMSGASQLDLTGGSLGPGETCTFSATLQVPAAAASGLYSNTTSAVAATVLGMTTQNKPAIDFLDVAGLTLVKSFTGDPAVPGGTATLEFVLNNSSPVSSATNITFSDDLDATLLGLTAVGLPRNDVCGAGSQITGTSVLSFTGGNLAPESSCAFSATLQVPPSAAPGEYRNITSPVDAQADGIPIAARPAVDDLTVSEVLLLDKSFTDDPVIPGDMVTLAFTIHNVHPTHDATNIAFADDLGAALPGLVAVSLPANDVCGMGSQIAGTSLLAFTAGSLAPDTSCTFSVTLQVPPGVEAGVHAVNTTSHVAGTIDGNPTQGNAAIDQLKIDSFAFSKNFDGPAFAGSTTTLSFTIQNLDLGANAMGISFADALDAVLPGLAAVGLPATDVCGPGSLLTGTSNLTLINGNLGPGAACTFDVTLQVPAESPAGNFFNTTSSLRLGGIPASSPASDTLTVEHAADLSIVKDDWPDPVVWGGTLTYTLAVHNNGPSAAPGVVVVDALPAEFTPTGNSCGASGAPLVWDVGPMAPGGSENCTVTGTIDAGFTGVMTNTVTVASGVFDPQPANNTFVEATLVHDPLAFAKNFDGPAFAGGTVTLSFTIQNLNPSGSAIGISFTDDLDAMLPGLVAVGLPATDACGPGSLISGPSILTLIGGNLGPGASCTFDVVLQVPAEGPAGSFLNTTSDLLLSSVPASGPASDTLIVDQASDLSIVKEDWPDPVAWGGNLTYTLTVHNNGPSAAPDVVVVDALPGEFTPAGNDCGASGTPLVWDVGLLAPGGSEICTVTGTTDAAFTGVMTNTVTVASSVFDPQPANNTFAEGTRVYDPMPYRFWLPLQVGEYAPP